MHLSISQSDNCSAAEKIVQLHNFFMKPWLSNPPQLTRSKIESTRKAATRKPSFKVKCELLSPTTKRVKSTTPCIHPYVFNVFPHVISFMFIFVSKNLQRTAMVEILQSVGCLCRKQQIMRKIAIC